MTAINSTLATGATTGATAPAGSLAATEGGEDRFLKLLVAQMRNQDPLNPLDNAQITSQMAQISTVSGIDKLNATIKAMAGGFSESQSLQAAALIGRGLLVAGNAVTLQADGAVGGFELAEPADQVKIEIRDGAGTVVHRADLGAQQSGVHTFHWDGANDAGATAQAGAYTFIVSALRGGAAVSAEALSAARVLAVSHGPNGTQFEVSGLGMRDYAAVKRIL